MNVKNPYRVHVILDPAFGQRLVDLPIDDPAWVVSSPINEPVVRELWKQRPSKSHLTSNSMFQSHGCSPEQTFLDVLDTVDLHHGEHSAQPPYSILEVVGCPASESIRSALAKLGFIINAVDAARFSAQRSASP